MITKKTLLFGLLDGMAVNSKRPKFFKEIFNEENLDASYIPMNVREDDIFFTVSNLKDSQLQGVNIGIMYKKEVFNYLKDKIFFKSSKEAKKVGFIDSIRIRDNKLYGFVTAGRALTATLKQNNFDENTKIAILGSGSLTKSIILNLEKMGVSRITLAKNSIESIPEMLEEIKDDVKNIKFDIERITSFMPLNGSKFDVIINATPFGQFSHDDFTYIREFHQNLTLIDFKEGGNSYFKKLSDENQVQFIGRDEINKNSSLIDLKEWLLR
jgi:shikimate 5-dehydrogenase